MAHVEERLVRKTIDQRWPAAIKKRDKTDGALLRLSVWKSLCLSPSELTPQHLVAAFGGADDLVLQRLQVVLQPPQRRSRCAFQRRINRGNSTLNLVVNRFHVSARVIEQFSRTPFILPMQELA